MSDQIDGSTSGLTSELSDNGLSPAASLTAIPVRRRRKTGAIVADQKPQRGGAATPEPADKARKETFGKMQPAADAVAPVENDESPDESGFDTPQMSALPPEGIIALWEGITGEAAIPALIDLDVTKVATHWPNSLLLRASGSAKRPIVEVARIFSADAAHNTAPMPIDTMTIDWMMALAREVTHDGVPVHELDNVSAEEPGVEYGVIALPFGDPSGAVDHVLCHLYRYESPPDEQAEMSESKARPGTQRTGRKVIASIFGRRQSAAG